MLRPKDSGLPSLAQHAGWQETQGHARELCIPGKSLHGLCDCQAMSLSYSTSQDCSDHITPNCQVFISRAPPLSSFYTDNRVGTQGYLLNTDHPPASATTCRASFLGVAHAFSSTFGQTRVSQRLRQVGKGAGTYPEATL